MFFTAAVETNFLKTRETVSLWVGGPLHLFSDVSKLLFNVNVTALRGKRNLKWTLEPKHR